MLKASAQTAVFPRTVVGGIRTVITPKVSIGLVRFDILIATLQSIIREGGDDGN